MNADETLINLVGRTWPWEGKRLSWWGWRSALGLPIDNKTAEAFWGRTTLVAANAVKLAGEAEEA